MHSVVVTRPGWGVSRCALRVQGSLDTWTPVRFWYPNCRHCPEGKS